MSDLFDYAAAKTRAHARRLGVEPMDTDRVDVTMEATVRLVVTKRLTCRRDCVDAICSMWGTDVNTKWMLWCRRHPGAAELIDVTVEREVHEPDGQEDGDR